MSAGGHLRQRSAGSFELRFRVNGRTHTETVKTTSKKVAAARLRELMSAVDKGSHVAKSSITVGDWTMERIAIWPGSAATRENNANIAKLIVRHIGAHPLQKLTTREVEQWHAELRNLGLAPGTIRNPHTMLTRALGDAMRHGVVARNVAREQSPPKAPSRKVKLPTEDLIAPMIEDVRGTEFHVPVVLTIHTACRRGEMLALRWCDVDLDRATMTISRALEETREHGIRIKPPKTESGERTIRLSAMAVAALRDHRRQQLERCLLLGQGRPPKSALVFPHWDNQPQSPRAFSLRWMRAVHRLKLPPVTWHKLRHLSASLLLRHGIDLVTVSTRLGHSKVSTTAAIYAHAVSRDDQHAAEALDRALGGSA